MADTNAGQTVCENGHNSVNIAQNCKGTDRGQLHKIDIYGVRLEINPYRRLDKINEREHSSIIHVSTNWKGIGIV